MAGLRNRISFRHAFVVGHERPAPRVAHLDHTAAPGGAEIALARVIRAGAPWDSVLLLPRDPSGVSTYLTESPFDEVVHTGPMQRPGLTTARGLATVRAGIGLLRQTAAIITHPAARRCDILHANSSRSAVYGAFAARILRRPFVVHLRDLISADSLGSTGFMLMRKYVLPFASGVIANSHVTLASAMPYTRDNIPAEAIPSPIGVDIRLERSSIGRTVTVGMIARIDRWKGQHLLIEAFAHAFRDSDARLRIVGGVDLGGAEYADQLRRLASELGIADRVEFVGHVAPDSISAVIDDFDICVQCSIRPEPLGQNILQYLARGKPIVAAGEGGPKEWIRDGENGLLFEPRDANDLAKTLARLANDASLCGRLSEGAMRTPLQSDQEIAVKIAALYDDVLARLRRDAR